MSKKNFEVSDTVKISNELLLAKCYTTTNLDKKKTAQKKVTWVENQHKFTFEADITSTVHIYNYPSFWV